MSLKYAAYIALLTSIATPAMAGPVVRWEKVGSTYIAFVTNPDDRAYVCSGEVQANYVQYDQPGSSKTSVNFGVGPKIENREGWRWNTTWASSTLHFSNSVSCS
jgi:hypothetical protein